MQTSDCEIVIFLFIVAYTVCWYIDSSSELWNTVNFSFDLNLCFYTEPVIFSVLHANLSAFLSESQTQHTYAHIGNCALTDKNRERHKEGKFYTVKLYPPEKPNHISWWWHDRNHMLLCPSSHYSMIHHFQTAAIKRRAGALRPDKSNITQNKVIDSWLEQHLHILLQTVWHLTSAFHI